MGMTRLVNATVDGRTRFIALPNWPQHADAEGGKWAAQFYGCSYIVRAKIKRAPYE